MTKTEQEYQEQTGQCRELFIKKMKDYGTAWRILRPTSLTDQIFIKANRIRSIQTKGNQMVGDDIRCELIGIVNYAAMALIQCERGFANSVDMNDDEALGAYDAQIARAKGLMSAKNHDYDEAWRMMRTSSITDIILMKLFRTKEIEDHKGTTLVSEGVEANYMDMINYAVFALIQIAEQQNKE